MSVSQPISIVQELTKNIDMQKKFSLVISLTIICLWVESKPLADLETNLSDLRYEVEEEDLDDFGKILDAADETAKTSNSNVKTSGFKNKKTASRGLKGKKNIEDLKKFYNIAAAHDQGAYDDDDLYGEIEGVAAQAVSVTGKEDRKYKKGTKTRGFHRVHHKDEYKKDKVIYEDDETSGVIKKVGAKGSGYKVGGGVGFSKGHIHHDRLKGIYGKRGYVDKGSVDKEVKGYSDSQGFDASFADDS